MPEVTRISGQTEYNYFRRAQKIVYLRPGGVSLQSLLIKDLGNTVYRWKAAIPGRSLSFGIELENGCDVRYIPNLGNLSNIYLALVEGECRFNKGKKIKVLFGWEREKDWGEPSLACLAYVYATRDSGKNKWEILSVPDPIFNLEKNRNIYEHQPTNQALFNGLGGKIVRRWWSVSPPESSVYYSINGERRKISGFEGYKKVFSLIVEEDNEIVAYFYSDEENAAAKRGLLKQVVLSEKNPRVVYSSNNTGTQSRRAEIDRIKGFLLEQGLDLGVYLDLAPRRVNRGREIRFGIDTTDGGGLIVVPNIPVQYVGQELYGRIVYQRQDRKKLFLWPQENLRGGTAGQILDNGFVMAQRRDPHSDEDWQISWMRKNERMKRRMEDTLSYSKYLFATVNGEVREDIWQVRRTERRGWVFKEAKKGFNGSYVSFRLSRYPQVGDQVFSTTREIARTIKFVQFYSDQDRQDYLTSRFITVRSDERGKNGEIPWILFWVKFSDHKRFKDLRDEGVVGVEKMKHLFSDDWLIAHYEDEVRSLVDRLKLY